MDSTRAAVTMLEPPDTGGVSDAICDIGLTPQSASGASWMCTSLPSLAGRLVTRRSEHLPATGRSTGAAWALPPPASAGGRTRARGDGALAPPAPSGARDVRASETPLAGVRRLVDVIEVN